MELGLIGKSLKHSFSPGYFAERATKAGMPLSYSLFELPTIGHLPALWAAHPSLLGLNVTVPYKTEVLPYLTELAPEVLAIGAANTLVRLPGGGWRGHNTDAVGFAHALAEWAPPAAWAAGAVLAGAGGAARAAAHALAGLGCPRLWVLCRNAPPTTSQWPHPHTQFVPYSEAGGVPSPTLLVNCTPAGMFPDTDAMPPVPVAWLGAGVWVYDMVYNPAETLLMRTAAAHGAHTRNGLGMLHAQADAAWNLWVGR